VEKAGLYTTLIQEKGDMHDLKGAMAARTFSYAHRVFGKMPQVDVYAA